MRHQESLLNVFCVAKSRERDKHMGHIPLLTNCR
ncbi:hypothetical protein T06_12930 [Trichinella sp. T6]|nr:hypothetical protein T06_12930 [Trichinella sp. T6]